MKRTAGLLIFAAAFALACGSSEQAPAPAPKPAAAPAPKPAAAPAPAAKPASTPDKGVIGVPECDQYLEKMEDCLSKMPEAAREASRSAMQQSRDAWAQAAATPAGKEGLKTACQAALDALGANPMCK